MTKVNFASKVNLGYNDQPRNPKFVAVVDRWSLFRGRLMFKRPRLGLLNGGRCRQVVVSSGLTLPLCNKHR